MSGLARRLRRQGLPGQFRKKAAKARRNADRLARLGMVREAEQAKALQRHLEAEADRFEDAIRIRRETKRNATDGRDPQSDPRP